MVNYGCTRYIAIKCFELSVNCIDNLTIKHCQFFRKHSRKFCHNLLFSLSMHGNIDLIIVSTKENESNTHASWILVVCLKTKAIATLLLCYLIPTRAILVNPIHAQCCVHATNKNMLIFLKTFINYGNKWILR